VLGTGRAQSRPWLGEPGTAVGGRDGDGRQARTVEQTEGLVRYDAGAVAVALGRAGSERGG
jgi:hypothetical protein